MFSAKVPVELYRDIISHVPPNDLFTLSITSRALSYEAERILYRSVYLASSAETRSRRFINAAAFLERKRAHHHLRELCCSAEDQKTADQLLMIFRLVENLESLNLSVFGEINCLPESPAFQLHTMKTRHPPNQHLKLFLESQQRLTMFAWNCRPYLTPTNYLSPGILPNLKFLRCSCQSLVSLQTQPIRGINLTLFESEDLTYLVEHIHPMTTVLSLNVNLTRLTDTKKLAELFPSVRYLEFSEYPGSIKWFNHVEKIRVAGGRNPGERASQIFANHDHLSTVETWEGDIRYTGPLLRYTRDLDHPSHVPYDMHEWRKL